MFVRKKRNRSGTVSVQIVDKSNGYRVVKSMGASDDPHELQRLMELAELFIARQHGQYSLFPAEHHDRAVIKEITYRHTRKILKRISVVFYDMTSLYVEAEDEDDLRRLGFSKDGTFQNPQIMLGLLVSEKGYPIGYDIFKGNTFEGKTLLPVLKQIQKRYRLGKPVAVADAAMLSNNNLDALDQEKFPFIRSADPSEDGSRATRASRSRLFEPKTPSGVPMLNSGNIPHFSPRRPTTLCRGSQTLCS